MKKLIEILCVILLTSSNLIGNIYAKSQEVYLLPSQQGEPSKVMSVDRLSAHSLIQYDCGESSHYLTDILPCDTIGVLFVPPFPCSLIEVHFCRYKRFENTPDIYYGIVADVPDSVIPESYGEYRDSTSIPGPSPIGNFYLRPAAMELPYTVGFHWDTLVIPGQPNIDQKLFWAGYTIEDTCHSTRVDLNVPPPFHAICWRQSGAGPETNGPGWYSSSDLFWIRALVKFYGQNYTGVSVEKLKSTYDTHDRIVHIYSWDYNEDSAGVGFYPDSAFLYYSINECNTFRVSLIQDSVYNPDPYSEDAWWHAIIPGQRPEVKVTYWVELKYRSELRPIYITRSYWYKVKRGRDDNGLLYIEGDEVWGGDVHNAFVGLPWDIWYEAVDGVPDNTVTDFYAFGPGGRAISWLSLAGVTFANPYEPGWSHTQVFRDFMDCGSTLLVSGQDIPGGGYGLGYGDWVAPPSPHPLRDYLKAHAGIDDYLLTSPFLVFVDATDVVTIGMSEEITIDCGSVMQPTRVGIFTDLDPACVPLFFDGEGNILGYRYESAKGFRVVLLYFPFHAITDTDEQDIFIENITNWFPVGVEKEPDEFIYDLPMVSPNPISRPTMINFTMPKNEHVSIKIYDVTGSFIKTLANERFNAGNHTLKINTDELISGVYFLKMDVGEFSEVRKFLVVK
ncbi:T9SS type A sorting domain-containing protein [candidate division WOR-3 bacterium]|nr:T9SS type A sorting domain-containing protein [candidate division WOR-3 bacterium]